MPTRRGLSRSGFRIWSNSGDFTWSDVVVFYRANFQSRAIEEGLRAGRIPYRIVSGVGFYQRAEIKDMSRLFTAGSKP